MLCIKRGKLPWQNDSLSAHYPWASPAMRVGQTLLLYVAEYMLTWLKNLLFPIQCLGGCGRYDHWLCSYCAGCAFAPLCVQGAAVDLPQIHTVTAVGQYHNTLLRRCVVELKYYGYYEIARLLGNALRYVIPPNQYDYVISVPLHRQRLRERGFNQTELIARQLGIPVLPALSKVRKTTTQATLNRAERLINLQSAFRVNAAILPLLKHRRVLLLDDVLSTGATLNACISALQGAQCTQLDVAVIALNVPQSVPWEGIEPSASRTATGRSIHWATRA